MKIDRYTLYSPLDHNMITTNGDWVLYDDVARVVEQHEKMYDALQYIARLHDFNKRTNELAMDMYSAKCVALHAIDGIKDEGKLA